MVKGEESLGRRMDDFVTKFDKFAHSQEQETKMHTTHILELHEGTTNKMERQKTSTRPVQAPCTIFQ
jgi:hypothetical protein